MGWIASGLDCEWVGLRVGWIASGLDCEWVGLRVGWIASGLDCEWVGLQVDCEPLKFNLIFTKLQLQLCVH